MNFFFDVRIAALGGTSTEALILHLCIIGRGAGFIPRRSALGLLGFFGVEGHTIADFVCQA